MKGFSILLAIAGLLTPMLLAEEAEQQPIALEWQPLKIAKSYFPRSIGMMDDELENYADNLAGVAIIHLRDKKANRESRDLARRMMALALHLSPHNKKALVLNFQLGKGVVPPAPETDYRPNTLARLLMKRAQLLEKQEGDSNVELAGYMFSLAAELDPKNEDAIYHSELFRINHADVEWNKLLLNRE